MKFTNKILLIISLILTFFNVKSQDYGPQPIKKIETKLIQGKFLEIPEYIEKAGYAAQFIPKETFKDFKTQKSLSTEWKRRWETAINNSTYDLTQFEVKRYKIEELKESKDKNAMVIYWDHDFYENWYVYLAIIEPKYQVVATAPMNGLQLADIDTMKLMMNMLAYSLINSSSYYGEKYSPLYRDHQNRYRKFIHSINDSFREMTLLVPKVKKGKDYDESTNQKTEEFLKTNWKISRYEMLSEDEINRRVAERNPNEYYMRPFHIHTANPVIDYQYYAVLSAANNDMLYGFMALKAYNTGNLKYMQYAIEKWLYGYMNPNQKAKYNPVTDQLKSDIAKKASASKKGKAEKPKSTKENETKDNKNLKTDKANTPKNAKTPPPRTPVHRPPVKKPVTKPSQIIPKDSLQNSVKDSLQNNSIDTLQKGK